MYDEIGLLFVLNWNMPVCQNKKLSWKHKFSWNVYLKDSSGPGWHYAGRGGKREEVKERERQTDQPTHHPALQALISCIKTQVQVSFIQMMDLNISFNIADKCCNHCGATMYAFVWQVLVSSQSKMGRC